MMSGFNTHGQWHAIIGLSPQYDHMEGTPMYEEYMAGYNSIPKKEIDKDEKSDIMKESQNE